MFPGESLPQVKSPLDKNDHPELDNSELASDDLITMTEFQSKRVSNSNPNG